MNSTKTLFISTMILGIMVSISSNNWIMIWSGIEISMMSFLPLMNSKMTLSSESSMKYFIIQSISSSIMMLGIMIMMLNTMKMHEYAVMISLLIKTGTAPFHMWLISIIEGMEMSTILMLLSMLKMAPLTLMSYLTSNLTIFIILTLLTGSILGINTSSTRKIMGYSSIFNMGFLIASIKTNALWILYLINYTIVMTTMTWIILKLNISYINQTMNNEFNSKLKLNFWITMLSMGGMPPTLGFMLKLMVIETMINTNNLIIITLMIMTSLTVMFYYMRITFMSMMFQSTTIKWKMSISMSVTPLLVNMLALPMLIMMKTLI